MMVRQVALPPHISSLPGSVLNWVEFHVFSPMWVSSKFSGFFSPHKNAGGWIGEAKLALGVNEYVNVYVR